MVQMLSQHKHLVLSLVAKHGRSLSPLVALLEFSSLIKYNKQFEMLSVAGSSECFRCLLVVSTFLYIICVVGHNMPPIYPNQYY